MRLNSRSLHSAVAIVPAPVGMTRSSVRGGVRATTARGSGTGFHFLGAEPRLKSWAILCRRFRDFCREGWRCCQCVLFRSRVATRQSPTVRSDCCPPFAKITRRMRRTHCRLLPGEIKSRAMRLNSRSLHSAVAIAPAPVGMTRLSVQGRGGGGRMQLRDWIPFLGH
jgi:hypothetical protein